jgi:NTE family protein
MKFQLTILVSVLLVLQGCASAKKKGGTGEQPSSETSQQTQGAGDPMGPPEAFGPPSPEAQSSYGPEPVRIRPVVLVFGPGLARGFAYAGVLQRLNQSKIPIGAIYGTEMGSLIGALYATSTSVNQFEWGLLKFRAEVFQEQKGLFDRLGGSQAEGKKLEKQLQQVFHQQDLSQTKIPLWISFASEQNNQVMTAHQGNLVQAIRSSMAVPGVLSPGVWTSGESTIKTISSAEIRPFLVQEAKSSGIGPVVVIDVLTEKEDAIAQDELKLADLVIRPNLKGISPNDYNKKTDAAFRGKNAIIQNMAEIRKLVGLPENDRP